MTFASKVLVGWGFGLDIAFIALGCSLFPAMAMQVLPLLLPHLAAADSGDQPGLEADGSLPPAFRRVILFAAAAGLARGLGGLYCHRRWVWFAACWSVIAEAVFVTVETVLSRGTLPLADAATPLVLVGVTIWLLSEAPAAGGVWPPFVGRVARHHFVVRAFNAAASAVPLPAIDAQTMVREAQRAEGLTDFGEPPLEPRLSQLCKALRDEARLSPLGHLTVRYDRIPGVLRNRLRAAELFRRHPEILERPIKAPIVITGLARSGTTLLHRLLAADPRLRGPRTWELNCPTLPLKGATAKPDPRIAQAKAAERAVRWLFPSFLAAHPVEAESVEEEVMLFDYASWLSPVPEATYRVPSFGAAQEAQDNLPAYQQLKRMLQLLDWQRPGERWVLKTPHHLWFLDHLFEVFPDAKVIQTHRDPVKCVPSICSLIAHTRSIMSDQVDPKEVGAAWTKKVYEQLSRSTEFRRKRGDADFLDIRYDDLMKDAMKEVRRVYEHVGMDLPSDIELLIRGELARHGQHRHGSHKYGSADFGVDEAEVRARFKDYSERFLRVPCP